MFFISRSFGNVVNAGSGFGFYLGNFNCRYAEVTLLRKFEAAFFLNWTLAFGWAFWLPVVLKWRCRTGDVSGIPFHLLRQLFQPLV